MSSGGIALASLAGYWAGEYSNSVVLAVMKVWTKGKLLWARTIGSTLVGELLDSLLFVDHCLTVQGFPLVQLCQFGPDQLPLQMPGRSLDDTGDLPGHQ